LGFEKAEQRLILLGFAADKKARQGCRSKTQS
jgi:hypothetical protein